MRVGTIDAGVGNACCRLILGVVVGDFLGASLAYAKILIFGMIGVVYLFFIRCAVFENSVTVGANEISGLAV